MSSLCQPHLRDYNTTSRVTGLAEWAAKSLVRVNPEKTWTMYMGVRYVGNPFLELNCKGVGFVDSAKGNARIFRKQYSEQASRARRAAGLCFAGLALVETALARVDPHLIAGADVSPDAVDSYVADLEAEHVAYLRRMLGLGSRAMLAPLFSETLGYRRADMALRYLDYAT